MKRAKQVNRQEVLRQMMELAAGQANDAVRLAYLTEEEQETIGGLNLTCLTEFKRNANGTVEVKLQRCRCCQRIGGWAPLTCMFQ